MRSHLINGFLNHIVKIANRDTRTKVAGERYLPKIKEMAGHVSGIAKQKLNKIKDLAESGSPAHHVKMMMQKFRSSHMPSSICDPSAVSPYRS